MWRTEFVWVSCHHWRRRCAGPCGKPLDGVEPVQIELDHCGLMIGVPTLERVSGRPPVLCRSEAVSGLVGPFMRA